jgi:hypothetical protein
VPRTSQLNGIPHAVQIGVLACRSLKTSYFPPAKRCGFCTRSTRKTWYLSQHRSSIVPLIELCKAMAQTGIVLVSLQARSHEAWSNDPKAEPTLPSEDRAKTCQTDYWFLLSTGAGEGNRTLVCSLGSCRSTIELRPQNQ